MGGPGKNLRLVERGRRVVVVGLLAAAGLSAVSPTTGSAQVVGDPAPSPREYAAMATETNTANVVLFGGLLASGAPGRDTWTWNGTVWTQRLTAKSPESRSQAAMAYDASTGTVVLFGGQGRTDTLGDTWTWSSASLKWTRQLPLVSPGPRTDAAMAYDAANKRIVLFGGRSASGLKNNETWTWSGATKTWKLQAPVASPPARTNAAMAYDPALKSVLLFGGCDGGCSAGDTWTWDGLARAWTRQFPATSPPGRAYHLMALDPARKKVVLFGGQYQNDFWTWDGPNRTWAQETTPVAPAPRRGATLAPHSGSHTLVLFAGRVNEGVTTLVNDTWIWDGAAWSLKNAGGS